MKKNSNKYLIFALCVLLFALVVFCCCSRGGRVYAEGDNSLIRHININIENENCSQERELSLEAFLLASKYGGIKKFVEKKLDEGLCFREIFDYLSYGLGTGIERIFSEYEIMPVNAEVKVNASYPHFKYIEGKKGLTFDRRKCALELAESLESGSQTTFELEKTPPAITVADLKARTSRISRYTTEYSSSSDGRKRNIALSLDKINFTVLAPNETFSFNSKVGERTKENGFQIAKVIDQGKYVDGLGGGVCQVATAVYNAAIKAGLKIDEVHNHTYLPSYSSPSYDAMVSNAADLKFTNDTGENIYLFTSCDGNSATVAIYGAHTRKYRVEVDIEVKTEYRNVDVNGLPLVDIDGFRCLYGGVDGYKSSAYAVYPDGTKTKIRSDVYRPYDKVFVYENE